VVKLGIKLVGQGRSSGVQAFGSVGLNTSMSARITPEQMIRDMAFRHGVRVGFIDEARRAATPHIVEWRGLSREDIGDALFEAKFCAARRWCDERCPQDYEIEPIRDHGRLSGRLFRFADDTDAALFKLWFL
jgi:hypothetical protein